MAAEVGGMSDERLCAHMIWDDSCGEHEGAEIHQDRARWNYHPFKAAPLCPACSGRQMVFVQGPNASHPCEHCRGTGIEPAAPSTDEGKPQIGWRQAGVLSNGCVIWREYNSGGFYGASRDLPPALVAAIRAPLERDLEVARMYAAGVEGTLENIRTALRTAGERIRELEAELNGTVETYVETTGDMGAEVLELRAEVERLREALRDALDTLLDYVPKRAKPYRNGWVDGWWALATPPSSTEGTKEVEG